MEKLQRFSIRKLSIGAVSCLIGTVSFLSYSYKVQAAETPQTIETAKAESEIQPEKAQESKPSEEAKGDTQNVVVDKNTVSSQETGAVTTVNQTGFKENAPVTNEVAKANEAVVINKAETNKLNGEGNETGSVDTTVLKTNIASKEAKQNIADLAISTKMKLQAIRLAKPIDVNNAAVVNTSDQNKSKTNASSKPVQTVSPEQSADSTPTTPVMNKASHESNSQAQPSFSANTIQTKLVRRPAMRLAAATATNSDELIVGKDVTISDFSVTAAKGKNEFEKSHANIKFTMHADDPSTLVDKRLTIQLDEKVWDGIDYSETKKANPTTISYQGQVIGTLNYVYPFEFVYLTFNNHVKDYTSINLQSDLVVAGHFQNNLPYKDYLYTPTQAKDGQTYYLTDDITIGQQKYSSNLPSVIHYRKLVSDSVSSVTNLTTTSYAQNDRRLYAGTFYKTPDGIYYSRSEYYSGNTLYDTKSGQPGYLEGLRLFVGTDMITDRTRSYTATFDIDQTKLSPNSYTKLVPIDSYSLNKYYWDDENLLPNTSDVYTNYSQTYPSTATADATVTKNSVIFNKLNGQSLATQEVSFDDETNHMTYSNEANYIEQHGHFDIMPALFKQLQAVAESDQNLTEAINTVTTTGRTAEIKLANPIDTGVKATITTSDGKTKEVPLLIDTIEYGITTASTAPKGSILVSAQGKIAKVYHHDDQNIPAVVDQSQLTKTITRTINVHEPGKSVTTTKQTVTLTQSVSVVNGKDVTYNGDWKVQGDSQWASYDVPNVPGYTASQNEVPATEVTSDITDQTVDISYTANSQTIHINYVDDDNAGKIVHATTVTGKTGETVSLNLTVPDKYQLADGQQLPTTYTFTAGSGNLTIRLAHKVVQREATVDVQIGFMTLVDPDDEDDPTIVVTQNQWTKLDDEIKKHSLVNDLKEVDPTVGVVGTLTGHVNYDLVDNKVVSFGNDWTTLNLGGQTYQMPNGTEVVNGIIVGSSRSWGEKLKEHFLKYCPDADPDYATYSWHGYLSVNKSNIDPDYAGFRLVGNEPNALAKVTGDRAATAIEMGNKPIDLSSLQDVMAGGLSDFNEQDGQLRAKAIFPVEGVYIPYVEKTATRTINVTTPDGKTTSVKQTATLAKQVTAQENAHPEWTTSEWTSYDVPVIPGYTASQSQIAKETVTGTTKDQTVNITYTANDGTQTIVYQDEDGSEIDKQVISGKTDEKVKVTSDVPDGYVLKGEVPSEVTIKPDDTPITVTVEHGKSHVTPDKPVNKGDLIPDTKDKHYPEGLTHNDLNKTVTREVTITDPSGKKTTSVQTVTFTRGATVDEVTNKVTYDDWSENGKHTFDKVDVPTVQGYTASGDVPSLTVTPDSQSTNVTVTYNANEQTATITYIDDTEKKTLGSDKQNGKFGQAITFATAPADEIENYKKQGYVLVSSTFDNQKYQADNSNNIFYVHLKHDTKNVSRNSNVNMTVHYVMDDNSVAPSDNKQTLSFTENGIQDLVTKDITWTPADSQTFKDVVTPKLTGYTADIKTANGKVVNFGDPDINVTVTYHANTQTATITYIDDTTKNTLDSKDASGKFGQAITFETAPADEIAKYEKQGYKLVSNDFNSNKYQADNNKNVFYVHFVHDTKKVNRDHSASFTVHYIYKDGKQAKPDHEQTLSFTEDGIQDLVTQKITWTPVDSQKFDDAITPVITGYTPDQDKVIGQTANFETGNREVTVTYLPNVQLGHINYIDDNTGKTLTRDDFSGRTNEHENYTPINRIQEFENKGYVFVSSDYPDVGFNFDDNDQQDQVFNVHLKHGIVTVTSKKPQIPNTSIDPDPHSPKYPEDISNTNSDVRRTIDYKFKDGKTAKPTVNDSLHFERTVVIDKVTGNILSDTWTPSQNFNDVQTPVVQGYTPNKAVVSDKNIGHDHQNIVEHVVYNPNAQHMTITYVDDTTGKELHTDKLNGVSDQDTKYTTSDTIKKYEDQHYKLVSDSTNNQDLIFDHDDKVNQVYEVHFKHGSHDISDKKAITETITYTMSDGSTAPDKVEKQVEFNRVGKHDDVTNADTWDEWQPDKQSFSAVSTPDVKGYTPDTKSVGAKIVTAGDKDINIAITYTPNKQKAKIVFIDDTDKKILDTHDLIGVTNSHENYDPSKEVDEFVHKHYVLVPSDDPNKDYPEKGFTYDNNDDKDQVFEVHFKHGSHDISEKKSITETITYTMSDDSKAPDKVKKQVEFNRVGKHDDVTNTDTWDEWQPDKQSFSVVPTPEVKGYTPDTKSVGAKTVTSGDKDITITITYTPNKQKAKIVFIDDTDKKILDTHDLIGVTNSHENYDPSKEIDEFVHKHYVLVPSDNPEKDYPEKGFTYDNNDNEDQVFEVHFKHGSHDISEKKSITETITYTMSDGSTAPDKVERQVEFNRVGKHDDVTGTDTWDEWQPNKQSFDVVPTPEVKGYTPDTKSVGAKTVTSGDKDITITITYTPNKQKAKVVFIDDTTKKILDTHDLIGVTNGHEKYNPSEEIEKFIHDNYVFVSSDYPKEGFTYDNDDGQDQVFEVHLKERPTESDIPTIPGNTEDNGGSNDTPTDSDEPEKDNGGSDTVDMSSHKTSVKRNSNKKHHGTNKINSQKNANKKHQGAEKTNNQKTSKTAKLTPNEVDTEANKLTQTKLGKAQESANNTLPQTGEKQSNSLAALGLAISSLGMIGAVKSKKRKNN